MSSCKPQTVGELQLYKVLQRANLLQYYDTFISQGGDDVAQLCEAGEEEFLEIMSLVGMATKPLHVRRLQKALQEWVTKPKLFKNISLNYRPVQSRPLSAHTPLVDDAPSHRHTPPSGGSSRLVTPPRPHSNRSISGEDTLHGFSSKGPQNDAAMVFDPLGTPTPDQIAKVANRLQAFGDHSLALALQLNERNSVMRETRKYVETIFQKSTQHANANASMRSFAVHLSVSDCRYLLRPDDLLNSAAKLANSANESVDKLANENAHQLFINQHKTAEVEKRLKIINVQREAFERKVSTADNPTQATEYQSELSRLTHEKFSLLQKKSELQRNYASLSASMNSPGDDLDDPSSSEIHDLSIKSPSSSFNELSDAIKHENDNASAFPISDSLKRILETDENESPAKLMKLDGELSDVNEA